MEIIDELDCTDPRKNKKRKSVNLTEQQNRHFSKFIENNHNHDIDLVKLFFSSVNIKEGDHWIWSGAKDKDGYGNLYYHGSHMLAHRLSYILHYNIDPNELYVLHKCNNPRCVNPNHLFLGTQKDNMKHMFESGRSKPNKGENNGRSVVTWPVVRQIREEYIKYRIPYVELAKKYGISKSEISYIVRNEHWTDDSYNTPHKKATSKKNIFIPKKWIIRKELKNK